ncbi:MAG: hypothetical protein LBB60_00510 [Desulfovibrio sp.]|jgi:hypothetical protein|nr:hypothetical protein [Desulfovibrio sp.]
MSFFSRIKKIFFQTEIELPPVDMSLLSSVPNPLIPWEIYHDQDPDSFLCLQGNEEGWLHDIWYPYWGTRTDEEKAALLSTAPTKAWREWLEWRDGSVAGAREFYSQKGLPFDHRTYLEDFKISYIRDRLQHLKNK